MPKRAAKQIYNSIMSSEYIIIVPHKNPDGDAIGSASALAVFFESIKKPYSIFCTTQISENLKFLPYTEKITGNKKIWKENKSLLIITVDSGDLEYAGIKNHINNLSNKKTIINIDHHATNTKFGDLNLVIEQASSTTEILYSFFRYNNIEITPKMATSLMTGLITDTGSFSNSGTSKQALFIASKLMINKADLIKIRDNVLKNKSINALKLWGIVLSRLNINLEHKIVYTYLRQKDINEYKVNEDELEDITNLLNNLTEGHAAMMIKEKKEGEIKASLRTTKEHVDVSIIAKHFGGGGHKKAAGFSLESNNADFTKTIEEKIEHIFNELTIKKLVFVNE